MQGCMSRFVRTCEARLLLSFAACNLAGSERGFKDAVGDKSQAVNDFWAFFVACAESNYIESSFTAARTMGERGTVRDVDLS